MCVFYMCVILIRAQVFIIYVEFVREFSCFLCVLYSVDLSTGIQEAAVGWLETYTRSH
jgi:hypothetical protein